MASEIIHLIESNVRRQRNIQNKEEKKQQHTVDMPENNNINKSPLLCISFSFFFLFYLLE